MSLRNGTCWKDIEGNLIQAHGGVIIKIKDIYYWYGENKDIDTDLERRRVDFIGISCYSSTNLSDWKYEGLVLEANHDDPSNELYYKTCVCERPKVIYNEKNKNFVMWIHIDDVNYRYASVGLAVSSSPTGLFKYLGSKRPNNRESRDMTIFQDRDNNVYMINSTDVNSSLLISKLDEDYTGFTGEMKTIMIEQFREAPVCIEYNSMYYLFTSGCTGWKPNPMLYGVSKKIMGSWRLIDNPCVGKNSRIAFGGQTTTCIEVNGKYYLLLDHWNREDLRTSGYSLLEVTLSDKFAEIVWKDEFDLLR